jgi:hypothetical protein
MPLTFPSVQDPDTKGSSRHKIRCQYFLRKNSRRTGNQIPVTGNNSVKKILISIVNPDQHCANKHPEVFPLSGAKSTFYLITKAIDHENICIDFSCLTWT